MEPCAGARVDLQLLNAFLAALNVALATWLANRRLSADKREANGKNGPLDQKGIDSGKSK